MKLKYKAILYETPEEMEYLFVSKGKRDDLNKPKPVDSSYINEHTENLEVF